MLDDKEEMSVHFSGPDDKSNSFTSVIRVSCHENCCKRADDIVVAEKEDDSVCEYNPHEHGQQRRPVHRLGATLLLLKYIIGAGILAMPHSFHQVGYLLGILGTVSISLLYLHVMHTLLKLEYDLCSRLQVPRLTFVGVVRKTFEHGWQKVRPAEPFFVGLMYFNYGVSNVLYNAVCLVMMAGEFGEIARYFGYAELRTQFCLSLLIGPLTAVCCLPNLKFLVPFSALTNLFTMLSMAVILVAPMAEFGAATVTNPAPQPTPPPPLQDIRYFPQFFAIVMGAFSCTGLVLPLKNDMAEPKYFTSRLGVLNVSVLLVALIYSVFSTKACFTYGEALRENVLSNLPAHQPISVAVHASYALAVAISFVYSFYITFDTLWSNYLAAKLKANSYKLPIKYATKTLINMFVYGLALAVPNFKQIATLSGSVGIVVDLGVPPLLHIFMIMKNEPTLSSAVVVLKDAVIAAIAISMFISSSVNSLSTILATD